MRHWQKDSDEFHVLSIFKLITKVSSDRRSLKAYISYRSSKSTKYAHQMDNFTSVKGKISHKYDESLTTYEKF